MYITLGSVVYSTDFKGNMKYIVFPKLSDISNHRDAGTCIPYLEGLFTVPPGEIYYKLVCAVQCSEESRVISHVNMQCMAVCVCSVCHTSSVYMCTCSIWRCVCLSHLETSSVYMCTCSIWRCLCLTHLKTSSVYMYKCNIWRCLCLTHLETSSVSADILITWRTVCSFLAPGQQVLAPGETDIYIWMFLCTQVLMY